VAVKQTKTTVVIGPHNATTQALIDAIEFAEKLVPKLKKKKLTVAQAIKQIKAHPLYAELEGSDLKWAEENTRLIVTGIRKGLYTPDEDIMYVSKILG
jgi:hypothetical protein